MAEWREATLGDLGRIVGGGTPSRDRPDYWRGTIPWLTPGELTGRTEMIVCETADRITELGLASSGARVVPPDTLLVTSRATIGSCALAGCEMTTNQGFKNLIPSADSDPRFLYFLMEILGGELTRRASGTTFLEVSGKEFARVAVNIPPLEEQRRIAEILDTINESIQATERVIAKRQSMLAGLAAELFDPGCRSGDWDERSLAQWTDPSYPITYGIVQAGPHVPDGVPYIRTGDMRTELRLDGLLRTSPKVAESYVRSRVSAGDIVCAIRATVGRVLIVPPELDGANLTQGTARIAPGADVDGHCLLWALRSDFVGAQIRSVQKGTTFQEITLQRLRSLTVGLPARREDQEALSSVLRSAEDVVHRDQASLANLREVRVGLAADLLSGRVRTVAA